MPLSHIATPALLALIAGHALAADPAFPVDFGEPVHTTPPAAHARGRVVGHVFVTGSGERIFYDTYQPVPERLDDPYRWFQSSAYGPCPDAVSVVYAVDPAYISGGNPHMPGDPSFDEAFGYVALRDWGDIEDDFISDGVPIDALTTAFSTRFVDPTPGDGMADPIVGNTLNIRFEDAQGGGSNPLNAGSQFLVTVSVPDLPSMPSDLVDPPEDPVYFITIDLGDADGAFELGDDDGHPEEPCVGDRLNPRSYADLDGDTYHDFSWDFYFDQPDLDPLDPSTYHNAVRQGIQTAYPDPDWFPGPYIDNPGSQDVYSRLNLRFDTPDPFDERGPAYASSWSFDGFRCQATPTKPAEPYGGFEMQLFFGTSAACVSNPTGIRCSLADLEAPRGSLTFADVTTFLVAFQNFDPIVDFNFDFRFTFADITLFLTAYAAGCP